MKKDTTGNTKNSDENVIFTKDGKKFDIPAEGSLGLLALGAAGVQLWRKKQREVNYKNPNENVIIEKKDKKKEEDTDEKKTR